MGYNLLAVGKGLLLDFVLLFLLLSIILISIKFPKKYGTTVALSTAFMFFLIAFGIASAGSRLMESWFGLETTFRAKFEATLAGSEKFSQELSSMTYEEALKSLPLTNVFKESLKTMYANGVEPGMTLGAFATEILAERATKMAFALSVGLIAGLIGYIAVAIIYVKLNLWGDLPNMGENIGGIFVRCFVSMFLIVFLTCLIPSLEFIEFMDTSIVFRWFFGSIT